MLNHANYYVCAITFTLNIHNHTLCLKYLAERAPKPRTHERYDVNVKTYLPTLITSHKETALPVTFKSLYLCYEY